MLVTMCIGNGQAHDAHAPDHEVAKTLNCMDDPMKILTVSQDAYDKYSSSDTSAALKNSGGNYGGGQRVVSDTVGALCARDYKGVGTQYVNEGKVIVHPGEPPER